MPPKRQRTEDEDEHQIPKYASEVPWLTCLTDPSKSDTVSDVVTDGEPNTSLITEACKLTYILYHDIQAQDSLTSILQALNHSDTDTHADLTRLVKRMQSSWKTHIVNKFLLPHVKEMVRKWRVAHPYARFESLPQSERYKLWYDAYDADPKSMVATMWKPVIKALDLDSVFETHVAAEDNVKMEAVQVMLRRKYFFGCECTYKYGILEDKKSKILDDWAAYVKFRGFAVSIVPLADVPISAMTLALALGDRSAKKKKIEMAEDGIDSASRGSTLEPLGAATVASYTPDHTVQNMQEVPSSPRHLSTCRTTSVAPLSAAAERPESVVESSSTSQNQLSSASRATATISEEARSLRAYFGITDDGLSTSAVRSEVASSARTRESAQDLDLL